MSNAVLSAVFEGSITKNGARLVLLALADRADDFGKCYPGIDDLMHRTGLKKTAVWNATNEAIAAGELTVEKYKGPKHTHLYTIHIPNRLQSEPFGIRTSTVRNPNTDRSECEHEPKENPKRTQSNGKRFDPLTVDLPFSSKAFSEAWETWVQHRNEIRHPLTPTATRQQLASLEGLGESRSISAIKHSVCGGYKGIFEPKSFAEEKPKYDAIGNPLNDAARRSKVAERLRPERFP